MFITLREEAGSSRCLVASNNLSEANDSAPHHLVS